MPRRKRKKVRSDRKIKRQTKVFKTKKTAKAKKLVQIHLVKKPICIVEAPTQEQIKQKEEAEINLKYVELINTIRSTAKKTTSDTAFEEIAILLYPRMQRLVAKFNIPGLGADDVMQEALVALKSKAIKDYDISRGTTDGPAPFERFAILCIRRHLSTERKASYQSKKMVLNSSVSLDQEQHGIEEDISLINIVPSDDGNVLDQLEEKEKYKLIMTDLIRSLSKFEKEVFFLYAQKNSYEEISKKINEGRVKVKVNIKAIDNALSRVKSKAQDVMKKWNLEHGENW